MVRKKPSKMLEFQEDYKYEKGRDLMTKHSLYLTVDWPGGRNSEGFIEVGNLKTSVSIPRKMDGPEIGTNPSDMLLGAAGTCYVITLAAMIERANLPLQTMEMESEGIVDITKGVITYKKIIHRPTVILQAKATDKEKKLLDRIIVLADKNCMISRAIEGNVDIELEPNVAM